jgi:hypothetical protein
MTGLELAYDHVKGLIGADTAESFEVVQEIVRLRSAWRPDRVRVILLAESHVWTDSDEIQNRVMQPDCSETGFARFVYCLGYGEPDLLSRPVKPNTGTPQYWRLFHDTIVEPTPTSHLGVMKSGEKDRTQRVLNKFELLRKMREAGIWLMDASICALVREGKRLVAGEAYTSVLKACWDLHLRQVLSTCTPTAVLIIGKGVSNCIAGDVQSMLGPKVEIKTIRQPNARQPRKDIECDRHTCFDLCRRHTG